MKLEKLLDKIVCGDCINKLLYIPNESIDLIYLDPPFFSKKDYEIIWGNGAEFKAYGDRWKGGVKHYIEWMRPRLEQCHRVLKSTGSIYLHCDKYASHYLKVMMDEIFGYKNFRNEIIWHYFMGGKPKRFFARKHDNILFYTKGRDWTFNIQKHKRRLDFKPSLKDESKNANTGKDEFGYYSVVTMDDVWDIKGVFNMSNEYMGYPTQKPEALLERIIKASSNEGDIVLDPFLGGGTTIAVAKRLKRNYIGIDVSPIGCATSYERLHGKQLGTKEKLFEIIDYPASEEDLSKLDGFQFQQWIMIHLEAICSPTMSSDGGIDGKFIDGTPIEVKKGAISRGQVQKFHSAIVTAKKKKGVIVCKSIPRTVFEKIAELKREGIEIIVLKTQEIIDGDLSKIKDAGIKIKWQTDLSDYV